MVSFFDVTKRLLGTYFYFHKWEKKIVTSTWKIGRYLIKNISYSFTNYRINEKTDFILSSNILCFDPESRLPLTVPYIIILAFRSFVNLWNCSKKDWDLEPVRDIKKRNHEFKVLHKESLLRLLFIGVFFLIYYFKKQI